MLYPAFFTKEQDGYSVNFPDFENAFTEGDTLEEAMEAAQEILGITIADIIESKESLPSASEIKELNANIQEDQFVSLVETDYTKYTRDKKPVKKTLTIPTWLNRLASDQDINFSQTLTEALKEKLGV